MSEAPTYEDRGTGRAYRDAVEMVNDYLRRFGESVNVELDPLDEDGYTDVRRGSATVGINVLEEHGILLFLSRIMDVPKEGRDAFYRRLLELNFLVTSDAAFAIDKDKDAVYLRALRRLSGLDFEEFEDLLHTMATVADEWDDRLAELFPTTELS
ncbi:MAG: YbjN domain-containing protein [Sandaracinaceae bacterium]|nr:YbjN domain-containing protein [Sandaracinaceae bacterium]